MPITSNDAYDTQISPPTARKRSAIIRRKFLCTSNLLNMSSTASRLHVIYYTSISLSLSAALLCNLPNRPSMPTAVPLLVVSVRYWKTISRNCCLNTVPGPPPPYMFLCLFLFLPALNVQQCACYCDVSIYLVVEPVTRTSCDELWTTFSFSLSLYLSLPGLTFSLFYYVVGLLE